MNLSDKLRFITRKKQSKKTLINSAIFMMIVVYILYHLLHGNRGLFALFEVRKAVAAEKSILQDLETGIGVLARKVHLLKPDSLDIDILEEQARATLNVASENEIIIDTKEIIASAKK
jgi:cell division protein FtsB